MQATKFQERLIIGSLLLFISYLFLFEPVHKLINSFDPNFQSSNSNAQYSQLISPFFFIKRQYSGRVLSSEYFENITYYDALQIDKPILFFTYTPSCPVSRQVKELIYPISEEYKDSFTFVVLKPPEMGFSTTKGDPINVFLKACNTPICVFNNKKNFLLSLNADTTTTYIDITLELEKFLDRSHKM